MTIWTITAHDPLQRPVIVLGVFTSQERVDSVASAFKEDFPLLDIEVHENVVQEDDIYLDLLEHHKELYS